MATTQFVIDNICPSALYTDWHVRSGKRTKKELFTPRRGRCHYRSGMYLRTRIQFSVIRSTPVNFQLEACLKHIFAKYCTPAVLKASDAAILLIPPPDAYLTEEDLQKWAVDTNGEPFSDETKEEMTEFFDITDDGFLTFVCLLCTWAFFFA